MPRNGRGDATLVLGRIRGLFERGEVRPGGRLPAERALADRFRTAHSSVRRALARLEEEGLIWRHVGQGTFFTGAHSVNLANAIGDRAGPIEVLEMRLMLEPNVAGMAALRRTSRDIKHTAIVEAIAARDAPAARRATRDHLETVRRNLLRNAS